jgi:NADH:ubiquinone oxidoreductase subunit E
MTANTDDHHRKTVLVCCGTGCTANGARDVFHAFQTK